MDTLTQTMDSTDTLVGDEMQLVSFNIGTEEFGVDILKVQEINRMVDITGYPSSFFASSES